MAPTPEAFAPFEPEILVATCSPRGRLITSNDAWQMMFGGGEDAWARLPAEDRALAAKSVQESAGGALVTNQIFPVQLPDRDEPLPVLLNFLPVHLPDETGRTTIQAVTVTGEVLAEPTSWTVSQTQRHRLEMLGRMTMGITHDFNNLLSGILGYTELLREYTTIHRVDPAFDEHLETIEKAALDGAALIRKIQQYIRQEKQTRFEPVDLPSLIQDCMSLTRPYWYNEPRRQGLEINLDEDLREVPPVMGSAVELREVLVNLILNAVQAMPQGGRLRLSTDFSETQGVRIHVADTGVGMSETVRHRIFEPLFTTRGERGTGMGLAVSYGIVQEHDGTIDVVSALGQGTEFIIAFPPAAEVAPPEVQETAAAPSRPARILLVDDERMVRSVLSKLLSLRGHAVSMAASGPEALSILETTPFDVVIADQAMPDMSGRELAAIIHRRWPPLPFVLLTGDTEIGEVGEEIQVILRKPFQIDEVEATVQALLPKDTDGRTITDR